MIKKSHFQDKEPLMEGFLSYFRFSKVARYIAQNSKVLDLGCGYNGFFLRKNRDRISSGVGIDILVDKNNFDSKIELISHDLNQALPFEENFFDVVVSLANLEHLKNPIKNLHEIFRVLKPGGLLLLTTPTTYAKPVLEFLSFKLKLVSEEGVRDHKNYFKKEKLVNILKDSGFSFVRHRYFQLFMNNFIYARK